jgi:fluoroacetyl-CoA thioesterase
MKETTLPTGSASMKETLRPGASKTRRLTVDRERTISFMGEEGRVYATPSLIRDVEGTCRELLIEHSDTGEESVGMEISLRHLAPTLVDMEVEITAKVVAVDGRKVTFEIAAQDEVEPIATSTHTRFVVDVAKRQERLKAKAAKRAAARAG